MIVPTRPKNDIPMRPIIFGPIKPPTIPKIIFFRRPPLDPIMIDANQPATAPMARDTSKSVLVFSPFNLLYYLLIYYTIRYIFNKQKNN